jgi:alpha-ribazole phosphatase/probable phosphoglycerate mutase
MIIYLIRHGETIDGAELRYKGHTDVPISANGRSQINRLALYLKDLYKPNRLSNVFCSDLCRAIESANIIAKEFGLKESIKPQLRERHFGKWEGKTFDEINKDYPDDFKKWAQDPLRFSPIDGESTQDVYNRVMPFFNSLIIEHSDQDIAIISHGGVNRIILCSLLCIPLEHIFRIEQDFAALNIIEFHNSYPVIKLLNYKA